LANSFSDCFIGAAKDCGDFVSAKAAQSKDGHVGVAAEPVQAFLQLDAGENVVFDRAGVIE